MTVSCASLQNWETVCANVFTLTKLFVHHCLRAMYLQLQLWIILTITPVLPQPFHGTGISLLQHPACADEGVDRGTVIMGSNACSAKTIDCLPHFYTDVPPITSSVNTQQFLPPA